MTLFFDASTRGELDGIVKYLWENYNSEIDDKIVVSSSQPSSTNYDAKKVLDSSSSAFFQSTVANPWIQLQFVDHFVTVTHYTIKSHSSSPNWLVGWTLEGSIDGTNFDILDIRSGETYLAFASRYQRFSCTNGTYQFFRIREPMSSNGYKYLSFGGFELFGTYSDHIDYVVSSSPTFPMFNIMTCHHLTSFFILTLISTLFIHSPK